jgi:hypothetical protein
MTIGTVLPRWWGEEEIIAWTPTYGGKLLRRRAGTKGHLQAHVKHESHYLLSGTLIVRVQGQPDTVMHSGSVWHVPPLVVHQEEAITDCVEIELADPTLDDRYVVERAAEAKSGELASMSDSQAQGHLLRLARALRARALECEALSEQIRTQGLAALVRA